MAELCRTWANTSVAMVTKCRVGDVVARIIIKQEAWKMFSTIMNMLSLMPTHEQTLIHVRYMLLCYLWDVWAYLWAGGWSPSPVCCWGCWLDPVKETGGSEWS